MLLNPLDIDHCPSLRQGLDLAAPQLHEEFRKEVHWISWLNRRVSLTVCIFSLCVNHSKSIPTQFFSQSKRGFSQFFLSKSLFPIPLQGWRAAGNKWIGCRVLSCELRLNPGDSCFCHYFWQWFFKQLKPLICDKVASLTGCQIEGQNT